MRGEPIFFKKVDTRRPPQNAMFRISVDNQRPMFVLCGSTVQSWVSA